MRKIMLAEVMTAAAQIPALSTPVAAQANATPCHRRAGSLPGESGAINKRVAIRMRGAALPEVLKYLSAKTGASFTLGENLADAGITIYFKNEPLKAILECLTKTYDLKFQRSGNCDNFRVSCNTAPFTGFPPLARKDREDHISNQPIRTEFQSLKLVNFLDSVSERLNVNFVVEENTIQNIIIPAEFAETTAAEVLMFRESKWMSSSRVGDSNTFVIR